MSTLEENIPVKRQKHSRACSICRKRKVTCDASERPNNRCSRCTEYGLDCEYDTKVKTRRPTSKYVQDLEARLTNAERLLRKLSPQLDLSEVVEKESTTPPQASSKNASPRRSSVPPSATGPFYAPPLGTFTDAEDMDPSDNENESNSMVGTGYLGKSSSVSLIRTLMDFKGKGPICEMPDGSSRHIAPRLPDPGLEAMAAAARNDATPYEDFPSPDTLDKLADAYFAHWNAYIPLLHRPTFERGVKEGLHLRDRGFGAVVLLVAAIGSACMKDQGPYKEPGRAPGWRWFEQVSTDTWPSLVHVTLYDVQGCALIVLYLNTTNIPHGSWTILGLGLRMAQAVGAHRKKMYSTPPTPEQEQWKRAFWIMVAMDRVTSFGMGRACAIHDEDFDLDLLTECDDEYWENPDPTLAFRQPPGKPSKVAFINCYIRLLKIQAFASRTIYTINKSKLLFGFVGAEWKQRIVAELDSALNQWLDTVPAHLRWDPDREDHIFLNQSALLYTNYYYLQICVHRRFIPSPRQPATSRLPLPSMTICTNAARACVHVLDVQFKRTGFSNCALTPLQTPLFTACIVLFLNLWASRRTDHWQSTMADVQKCLDILKQLEASGNQAALKLRAVLQAMISTSDIPSIGKSAPAAGFAAVGPHSLAELVSAAMQNLNLSHVEECIHPSDVHLPTCIHSPSSSSNFTSSESGRAPNGARANGHGDGNGNGNRCGSMACQQPESMDELAARALVGCDPWIAPGLLKRDKAQQRQNQSELSSDGGIRDFFGQSSGANTSAGGALGSIPEAVEGPGQLEGMGEIEDYSDFFASLSDVLGGMQGQGAATSMPSQWSPPFVGGTAGNSAGGADTGSWFVESNGLHDNPLWKWCTAPDTDLPQWEAWNGYLDQSNRVGPNNPSGHQP